VEPITVFGWFAVLIGVGAIGIGGVLALRSLRAEDRLKTTLERALDAVRVEAKAVYDQAEQLLDEARATRNREVGKRGGRPKAENGEAPQFTSREQYLAYVEKHGRTIPEWEARFFG